MTATPLTSIGHHHHLTVNSSWAGRLTPDGSRWRPMSSGLVSTTPAGSPAPPARLGSARLSSPRADPPSGAQLCLPHEVAGQLLPQLDAALQRRLTECTVQQDLVRLADSKIVAEEAEMLFGVFLPRDLHAWLPSTETTKLQHTPSARPATGDTHFPRI